MLTIVITTRDRSGRSAAIRIEGDPKWLFLTPNDETKDFRPARVTDITFDGPGYTFRHVLPPDRRRGWRGLWDALRGR